MVLPPDEFLLPPQAASEATNKTATSNKAHDFALFISLPLSKSYLQLKSTENIRTF
ncbi:hypothetical protein D3C78_818600 [compost metagenome]